MAATMICENFEKAQKLAETNKDEAIVELESIGKLFFIKRIHYSISHVAPAAWVWVSNLNNVPTNKPARFLLKPNLGRIMFG